MSKRLLLLCFLCWNTIGSSPPPLLPRFASLKRSTINLRVGPGEFFPISCVYKKENLPIQIVAEFEDWRQIQDYEGTTGWVHKRMLKGNAFGLVIQKDLLLKEKDPSSKPIATLEKGVLVELKQCEEKFCKVKLKTPSLTGWFPIQSLWGQTTNKIHKNQ